VIAPAGCDFDGANARGRCSHSPDTINPIIASDHFSWPRDAPARTFNRHPSSQKR
jgi:hypothetical protein